MGTTQKMSYFRLYVSASDKEVITFELHSYVFFKPLFWVSFMWNNTRGTVCLYVDIHYFQGLKSLLFEVCQTCYELEQSNIPSQTRLQ